MPIFKIEDRETVVQVNVYEVEAETKEEALEKYINELAGSLPSVDDYIRDTLKEGEESMEVVQ